jgi:hypothetical protein
VRALGRGRHLLDKLTASPEFPKLLRVSLLDSADPTIRVEVADLILTLYLYACLPPCMIAVRVLNLRSHLTNPCCCSAGGEESRKYFLVTLFEFLPTISSDSQRCSEFFIVLSELIKQYCSTYVSEFNS